VRKEDLARIQHPRLPLSYFALLRQALERLAGVDNLVLSHLPEVTQPDIVPEIADCCLRMDGKTWSLCTGTHGDRIYLSLRTTKPRADAGKIMRRLVSPTGRGGGHGKHGRAAGCRARRTSSGQQATHRRAAGAGAAQGPAAPRAAARSKRRSRSRSRRSRPPARRV
jgi:nanoRNase/pAp phosphatase (c-di-AMP/oligoRNAs hydrolase)